MDNIEKNDVSPIENDKKTRKHINKPAVIMPIIVLILLTLISVLIIRDSNHDCDEVFYVDENTSGYEYGNIFTTVYKPAIYLYPTEETNVTVKVIPSDNMEIKTTYPKYNNEWNVIASEDGVLMDESGRRYDYLFYDLTTETLPEINEGYCVHKNELIPFLEDALAKYGLNEKEANEFIAYWLPLLEENEYNLIAFANEWYQNAVELEINPTPDNVLRLFMLYKPVNGPIDITPPEIPAFNRTGFTVIEWGGAQIK